MAKQTLVIESPMEPSLQGGMVVITDKGTGEVTMRPLEDVGMVMVDNIASRFTIPLLNKLMENNVTVVFCNEKHMLVLQYLFVSSDRRKSITFRSMAIKKKNNIFALFVLFVI